MKKTSALIPQWQTLVLASTLTLLAGCPVSTQVKTDLGILKGAIEADGKVVSWKGIPYAQAPVDGLRWQAPRPAQPWDGVRSATEFGNACMQIGSIYGPSANGGVPDMSTRDTIDQPIGSEDCLYLNIWRPASNKKKLPVVLYVHGGSNMVGAASLYRGTELAKQDVVFVSLNYRLNLFGWLNHPALKVAEEGADPFAALTNSGNYATLDVLQAARFVHDNIDAFGGDPDNVTLVGQSAGASNAYSLMVSPLAAGLFHQVAMLSPGLMNQSPQTSFDYTNGLLMALALQSGLATDPDSAALWLMSQTPEQLRAFLYSRTPQELTMATTLDPRLGLTPAILRDGLVQPEDPDAAVASGQFNNVPVMMGVTEEEGKLFTRRAFNVNDYQRWTWMLEFNPDEPDTTPHSLEELIIPALLPVDRPQQGACGAEDFVVGGYNAYANLCGAPGTSLQFRQLQDYLLLPLLATQQSALYAYQWSWDQQSEPWRTVYGSAHGSDVPFLLGQFDTPLFSHGYSRLNAPGREQLSESLMDAVVAFAKTGNPNHAGLPVPWSPWSPLPGQPKRLILDANDQVQTIEMSVQ